MDDAFTDDNVALGEAAQVNFKIAARTQHGLAKKLVLYHCDGAA